MKCRFSVFFLLLFLTPFHFSLSAQEWLAIASVNGQFGFINDQGKWKIEARYASVKGFMNGLAAVKTEDKWGFIDTEGREVIPAMFDSAGNFEDPYFAQTLIGKKLYYIDRKGDILLEVDKEMVWFREELALVKAGRKWGYLNRDFTWEIPPLYDMAWPFKNGQAKVKKDGRWFMIDKTGKETGVLPAQRFYGEKTNQTEYKRAYRDENWGFTDVEGNWKVHPVFTYVRPYAEGFAPVKIGDSWGFIDKEGSLSFPAEYEDAHIFTHGLASVRIKGKYGCIDTRGELLIKPRFDFPLFFYEVKAFEADPVSQNDIKTRFFALEELDMPEVENQTSPAYIPEDTRIALIIGNSEYERGGYLANPENDAIAMAETLQDLGFVVMISLNASQTEMKESIDRFGQQLKKYDIGLFFYAGHGIQVKGYNYLIPVDAKIENENDVEYNCVEAGRILSTMEASGNKTNLIILDACRNNPFERSWTRSSQGQGLAFMSAPSGSLVAYATAPGRTASDGTGSNGLYTSCLLKNLRIPGLTILEIFQKVRLEVREKSANQQVPWESTSLEGNFYFIR